MRLLTQELILDTEQNINIRSPSKLKVMVELAKLGFGDLGEGVCQGLGEV